MARSIETNIAIDKIWKSFDKKQMLEGFEILQQASKNGDADACCFLGRCYMGEEFVWDGAGFPVDEQLASQLIKQSVLYGSADGVMCALRTGNLSPAVRKEMPFASLSDAFDMVKANAQAGDAFSQYEMGNAMFYGDYLTIYGKSESDKFSSEEQYNAFAYPIAAKYYAESFKNGLSAAFGNYRSIYFSELAEISTRDFEAEMKRLADYGDPRVCNDYGKWLDDQYNDKKSAFRYYVMALEQGDLQSAYNVAVCYATGRGVSENLDKAFQYYRIAAEAGHEKAQFQLGNFYFEGRGNVEQDYAKAVLWLEKAYHNMDAEDSWQPAAELAICYQSGLGIYQDDSMAYDFLSEIEENEFLDDVWEPLDAMVLNALGVAYGFGRGTEQNIPKAIEYFDRAIEYDSEEAVHNKARFKKNIFGHWKLR